MRNDAALMVRLPKSSLDRLEELATALGVTKNIVIRQLVNRAVVRDLAVLRTLDLAGVSASEERQ